MAKRSITVQVKMDRKTLRSFAVFDTFILKKQWRKPAVFSLILLVFAFICLFAVDKEQHVLIGSVLLAIAAALPFSYIFMFLSGVKEQARRLKLPRRVYTLSLSGSGIAISNDIKKEETVWLEWSKVHALHRRKNAIYLYASPARAFILPNGQADATPDELWQMMTEHVKSARK
ncbi:MAG: hypothetical protein IKU70_12915 [Clostridia bacterium]|nr:hypothetical protein [Clostridia bacterium]